MIARLVALGLIGSFALSVMTASAQAPATTQTPAGTPRVGAKASEPPKKAEDLDKRVAELEKNVKAADAPKKDGDACCCPDAAKKGCDACCYQGAAKSNEHLEAIAVNLKSSWLAVYILVILAVIGIAVVWIRLARSQRQLESLASNIKTTSDDIKSLASNIKTTSDDIKSLVDHVKTTGDEIESLASNVKTTSDEIKSLVYHVKTTSDDIKRFVDVASSSRPIVRGIARAGQHFVIYGEHLESDVEVKFNEMSATLSAVAENHIIVPVPSGGAATRISVWYHGQSVWSHPFITE